MCLGRIAGQVAETGISPDMIGDICVGSTTVDLTQARIAQFEAGIPDSVRDQRDDATLSCPPTCHLFGADRERRCAAPRKSSRWLSCATKEMRCWWI